MPQNNPFYPRGPGRRVGTDPATLRRKATLRRPLEGGPVTQLPIVVTLGVNAIGPSAANVVGSVVPNGVATSSWITYGTSLPLPGTSTTPTAIGSGTTPVTVTFTITGLTTGATYYAAVVAQGGSGTVIGQTIAFVPTTVSTPSQPITPYGQSFVTIPHFDMPFQLVTTGVSSGAVVVEQDTLEEVLANVNTVVSCAIGQCPQLATFGRPDDLFSQSPVDTTELVAAIQQWEPRASEAAVSQLNLDGSGSAITLTTSTIAAQGV